MNLRWLLFDYADPALPLSFRQRMKINWRRVPIRKLPRLILRRRIAGSLMMALPMVIVHMLLMYLSIQFTIKQGKGTFLIIAVPLLMIPLSWIWIGIAGLLFFRPEYYYRLRLEGFDVCLGCGYWLRGLDDTIAACPECGANRELMPDSSEVKQ